jgi:hypothetical protein
MGALSKGVLAGGALTDSWNFAHNACRSLATLFQALLLYESHGRATPLGCS